MLLAFPLGLFIKGRNLKPLFYIAAIGVFIFSISILLAAEFKQIDVIYTSAALWGMCYGIVQVLALPFIIRNTSEKTKTAAISLSYATYSLAMILAGIIIFVLNHFNPLYFD